MKSRVVWFVLDITHIPLYKYPTIIAFKTRKEARNYLKQAKVLYGRKLSSPRKLEYFENGHIPTQTIRR